MPKTYTLATESLLKPLPRQNATDRRAWSIPLGAVWIPYFTAMKVAGKVDMADDTLGAPLRLATEKDGTPRFSIKGEPMLKMAKELNDQVRVVRDNFVAALVTDTGAVQKANPTAYKAQVERAHAAGEPLLVADAQRVLRYLEAVEAVKAAAEAAHAQPAPEPEPERELVAA